MVTAGSAALERAAAGLASHIPEPLAPLARLAYNYRWSWMRNGGLVFGEIEPRRWEVCRHNPVQFLRTLPDETLTRAAANSKLVGRARAMLEALDADLRRPEAPGPAGDERPLAYLCAEFGVHRSLPIYSGGLGVLAGDMLKEASDRAIPCVGVGLLYRQGYFHQYLDTTGWQHQTWSELDVDLFPGVLVSQDGSTPLTFTVPIGHRDVVVRIWRVDVGRVPLFLLDTNIEPNDPTDRWITSRLYIADRQLRLAQYALLGTGAVRALRVMDIESAVFHMNEGHAALATLELAREWAVKGADFGAACEAVRQRTVFTTHTPVAAGNEGFGGADVAAVIPHLPAALGVDMDRILALGRIAPNDGDEPFGVTPLGIRMSWSSNAVSRRHGEVARAMWQTLFPGRSVEEVPITHVTNGVHLPTWMSPLMAELLDRHLGAGWQENAADPAVWAAVDAIPDSELWDVRCALRSRLVDYIRERSVADRLYRGEPLDYVEAARLTFNPDTLTVGFARRIATYKRLHLLIQDMDRALALLDEPNPIQILIAGKAHPLDDEAKAIVKGLFEFKRAPNVAGRVAFLEDYDIGMAKELVAGCDVWANLPRPPMEASGTSGMKAALNGGLNLSVLDGWWEECWNGENGWGIRSPSGVSAHDQDVADASEVYRLVENEVVPLFYTLDKGGVPAGWVRRVKASLRTVGPQFNATRMITDYMTTIYARQPVVASRDAQHR